MKTLVILIFTMLTFYASDIKKKKITSQYNCTTIVENEGRCTGSAYCSACSNCSRCAHCSNGGTCGVCSGTSSNSYYNTPKTKKKYKTTTSTYYYEPVEEAKVYHKNEPITIYYETINLREKPNTKSIILEKLSYGDTVIFIEKAGEWSKIKDEETGTIGFVFSKLLNF